MLDQLKSFINRTSFGLPLRAAKSEPPTGESRTERDDRAMLAIMAEILEPTSTCIDIGANEGRVLNEMVRIAPEGRHFAFEAIPQIAGRLQSRFPQAHVRSCALSDEEGSTTFYHAVDLEGWSGMRKQRYPLPTRVEEIQIRVYRLDDVFPKDANVRFIKIDVEGAELHVLRGARDTIRRCRPHIVFEYAEIHGSEYGTTPELLYDYLTAECGLVVRSLLRSRPRYSRGEFIRVCRRAAASNYDRSAETNFYASPD